MAQTIFIRVTQSGDAVGPFNIYWDSFVNILSLGVSLTALQNGVSVTVPDAAQIIVLENLDPCGGNVQNQRIIALSPTPSVSVTPSYSVTPSVTPSISVTPSFSVTPSVSVTTCLSVRTEERREGVECR